MTMPGREADKLTAEATGGSFDRPSDRCPIGLDISPGICSAGTCWVCILARLEWSEGERERLEGLVRQEGNKGQAELSVADQAAMAMFVALAKIAGAGAVPDEAASIALAAIKEAETIRREGEPLRGIETSDREHGEQMGQPPGVLYTLTITDEGNANEWRSDRVRAPEQIAWLHEIVMAAAAQLAGTAGGGVGLN